LKHTAINAEYMNNMTNLKVHIYSETIRDYVQSKTNCKKKQKKHTL